MNIAFRPLIAECIGAFALIFIGILSTQGVSLSQNASGFATLTTISLAHGLTIAVMVSALGANSGGHFNPAITAAFMATGRITPIVGVLYILAQLLGATAGGLLITALFDSTVTGAGVPALSPQVSATNGVILEAVTTFFLTLVVFGAALDPRAQKHNAPLAIGFTVALGIMATGPLTGGAINPARAFGPALASGVWTNQLVYWVGPLVGGIIGGLVQNFAFMERK
jgi:MIP family channel proteins